MPFPRAPAVRRTAARLRTSPPPGAAPPSPTACAPSRPAGQRASGPAGRRTAAYAAPSRWTALSGGGVCHQPEKAGAQPGPVVLLCRMLILPVPSAPRPCLSPTEPPAAAGALRAAPTPPSQPPRRRLAVLRRRRGVRPSRSIGPRSLWSKAHQAVAMLGSGMHCPNRRSGTWARRGRMGRLGHALACRRGGCGRMKRGCGPGCPLAWPRLCARASVGAAASPVATLPLAGPARVPSPSRTVLDVQPEGHPQLLRPWAGARL